MTLRFGWAAGLVATLVLALGSGADAQEAAPPAPAATVRVVLATEEGPLTLELYTGQAPLTTANFLRYVDGGLYDGATFYRASRPAGAPAGYGLLEGGLRDKPTPRLAPVAHESTLQTGLSHVDGAVSLARFAPGSGTSEFFISLGDQSYLDANPKAEGDNQGFAVFARVVDGLDVARRILAMPQDPNAGEGVMKGEILAKPVTIVTARRAPTTP